MKGRGLVREWTRRWLATVMAVIVAGHLFGPASVLADKGVEDVGRAAGHKITVDPTGRSEGCHDPL
ncbi:MAG: hypothetical protein K6F31_05925 [Acetatifactor sp.]|nr:hypothetical protein [Acetatifactor sp.]